MYSPRSVSTGRTPAASSASFSPISSVAIDFDFATSFAPRRRQTSATYALASSAVRAKKTRPPAGLERLREPRDVAVEVVDHRHPDRVRALAQRFDVRRAPPTPPAGECAAGSSTGRARPGRGRRRACPARSRGTGLPAARAQASTPRASAVARWTTRTGAPDPLGPAREMHQAAGVGGHERARRRPHRRACRRPSPPRPRADERRTSRRSRSRDPPARAAPALRPRTRADAAAGPRSCSSRSM